jgi:hypothetical protein
LFQQRDQGTARGVGLADLRSALEGKLSTGLDAQVLIPHLSETAEGGEEPAGSRSTVAVRRQGSDDGHNDVLAPATRRISPGSLVTTVIWPSDADWMTAPMCESATETPIRSRMPAAVLALTVSSG